MPEGRERELTELDRRLTRIETLLIERDRKSDAMMALISGINEKLDGLQDKYVSRREFDEYKSGVKSTAAATGDGIKAWQGVVFALITLGASAGMSFLINRFS